MNRHLTSTFLAALFTLTLNSACAQSEKVMDFKPGFNSLVVTGAIEVTCSESVTEMTVNAPEQYIGFLCCESRNGVLNLWFEDHGKNYQLFKNAHAEVLLPASKNLESVRLGRASRFKTDVPISGNNVDITVSGASSFESSAPISGQNIRINLSGASSMKADVRAAELDLDCTGASSMRMDGNAKQMKLKLSGASRLKGDIDVLNSRVSISGASSASFSSDGGAVSGSVSGASNLDISGRCTNNVKTSGASSISIH